MKSKYRLIIIAILGLGLCIGIALYLFGKSVDISNILKPGKKETGMAEKKEGQILYYRHSMNPQITSPTPKKDEMGMDYIPVYEEEKKPVQKEKRVLFYRHPMDPKITSPTPKKDEMDMVYIPVYEEEPGNRVSGTVSISPEKIQKIGVKSEEVKRLTLKRTIRTVGRVDHDESKVFTVTSKVGGWIEKLYVNKTDQMVHPGDHLLDLYSPDLVATQQEYLLALKARERVKESNYEEIVRGADSLVEAARQRLKYWDISDGQIKKLEEDKKITRTMTIYSPVHGIVTEKIINEGMRIEPGEMLFKIIDHSQVWVFGEVYEYELPFIKIGQRGRITPSYTPADVYEAAISNIYTHFGTTRHETDNKMEEARTAKIRFELPNPEHKLKLGQFVNVEVSVDLARDAIAVPESSVIDTGTRQVVILDKKDGRFEPRDVKVGAHGDGYYQIISGIEEGEWVVTSANFLIDSESSFKAALQGMKGY